MRDIAAIAFALFSACAPQPPDETYDVVVYGGTSGGVVAAIAAAQHGRSVVLIEPTGYVGGLTTSGLGATDIGNKAAIGGLSREFYRRVGARYGEEESWRFEPHVAQAVYDDWLSEHAIVVRRRKRLLRSDAGIELDGTRIVAITTESGSRYAGQQFIDATYEGDLMALAGVSYTVGREGNDVHDETLNGVQVGHAIYHQFTHPVDPYVVPGDPASGLLPGVGDGPGIEGTGDHRVQAYCFRICATANPDNRVPWPRPDDHDPALYELLLRSFDAGDRRIPWHPVQMPNGKTDSNNNFAVSTDFIGANYAYPEGSYDERERIVAAHRAYQQGLLWTLANHDRVPDEVRAEFQRYGLAADEFTDNDHWPRQLYIREARRMVSDYVMTEHDCMGARRAADPVGLGAYTMDSHHVQRYVDADGHVRNEGDVQVGGFPPYPVSFAAIRPRREECSNLTVPVCVSASHIAFGSIRMEPVFMVLGHSAAIAATIAIERGVAIADVEYDELRERLLADGQVLEWKPAGGTSTDALEGTTFDDDAATFTGRWWYSVATPPFVGRGYRHDGARRGASCVFPLGVDAGRYEVRLRYPPHENRAPAARVTIHHAAGVTAAVVDQRRHPVGLDHASLGVFPLDDSSRLRIERGTAEGHVVVDAIQLVRQAEESR